MTGVTLEQLDSGFRDQIQDERRQLASVINGLPNPFEQDGPTGPGQNAFMQELREGYEKLSSGDYDEAEDHFIKSLEIYDKFTDPGNPYQGLAAVYRAQGDDDQLASHLERYLSISEHAGQEAVELAKLLETRGDRTGAIYYYERSLDVAPYNREVQTRLAELYTEAGNYPNAVRARQAVLGLNPVDRADAYYQFALSLYQSDRVAESKRAVLQSLELAPGFREAQKLLLDVVEQ